jgi:hypothetical protein
MAGVWRHILRLPAGLGKRSVGELSERAREVVGLLSAEHRAVHLFVARELPRLGRPIPSETIAEGVDLPLATVTVILDELEARKGFLFRNEEGAVVWVYPMTVEVTPHRIRFRSGETLYGA